MPLCVAWQVISHCLKHEVRFIGSAERGRSNYFDYLSQRHLELSAEPVWCSG